MKDYKLNDDSQTEVADLPLEVLGSDSLAAMERSSVDMQVATAKKYPRDLKMFLTKAKAMVSMDAATAESCSYKLKRTSRDGKVTYIEGPSIRLLEIVASTYQNLRFGSRIVGIDDSKVTVQGVAHDMENNVYISVEVPRRITTSSGKRFSEDMVIMTANAAGSIARRNALLSVIPRCYISQLEEDAKVVAQGKAKPLVERRQTAFNYLINKFRVTEAQILTWLGKASMEECNLEDIDNLNGLRTALKEGETTIEREFPEEKAQEPPLTTSSEPKAELKSTEKTVEKVEKEKPVEKPAKEKKAPAPAAGPEMTNVEKVKIQLEESGIPLAKFIEWGIQTGNMPKGAKSVSDLEEGDAANIVASWKVIFASLIA